MANSDDATLIALLEAAYQAHDRLGALLDDIKNRVKKEPTAGQEAKKILDWCVKEWEKRWPGEKFVVNGAEDMAKLKRLLRQLHPREVCVRWRKYLDGGDRFVTEKKHPLGLFVKTVNQYGGGEPRVRGCEHAPACTSGAEHTQRQMAEMRAGR